MSRRRGGCVDDDDVDVDILGVRCMFGGFPSVDGVWCWLMLPVSVMLRTLAK